VAAAEPSPEPGAAPPQAEAAAAAAAAAKTALQALAACGYQGAPGEAVFTFLHAAAAPATPPAAPQPPAQERLWLCSELTVEERRAATLTERIAKAEERLAALREDLAAMQKGQEDCRQRTAELRARLSAIAEPHATGGAGSAGEGEDDAAMPAAAPPVASLDAAELQRAFSEHYASHEGAGATPEVGTFLAAWLANWRASELPRDAKRRCTGEARQDVAPGTPAATPAS